MEDTKNSKIVKNNEAKDLSVAVSNAEQFIEKNAKWILICAGVIVVGVVLYFLLLKPALQNRERNAAADNFKAEFWFDQGEYELALNGSDSLDIIGFVDLATENKGTKANNMANCLCFI